MHPSIVTIGWYVCHGSFELGGTQGLHVSVCIIEGYSNAYPFSSYRWAPKIPCIVPKHPPWIPANSRIEVRLFFENDLNLL